MTIQILTFVALIVGIVAGFFTIIKFHTDLKKEINNNKTELKDEINYVRIELKETKMELKEDIANVRIELKDEISKVRAEMSENKIELITEIANVRVDFEKLRTDFEKLNSKFDKLQINNSNSDRRVHLLENFVLLNNGNSYRQKELAHELEY